MINDIFVCVNNIQKRAYALHAACKFADRHNATVTGVYIKLDTVEIVRWAGSSAMKLANQFLIDQHAHEDNAHALFDSLTAGFVCKKAWNSVSQSSNPMSQMLCSDIIFAEQPVGDELSYTGDASFINHLILQTKRPVIMIPTDWRGNGLGTKILLGWNNSAEAMRAAAAALPIMQQVKSIEMLQIIDNSLLHAAPDTLANHEPDIESYLKNRGVEVNMYAKGVPKHSSEQSVLLDFANEHKIDLLVMGGYGHSRLREVVMGGMTKSLIENSSIPVLFSH